MGRGMAPTSGVDTEFERLLRNVERPFRYIGGEWNSVTKDHREVATTFALAFPDAYEVGMSHLGFRILYSLLNAREDTAAERVFCPWPDMAEALRRRRVPLGTLETRTPLHDVDVVGFSLQHELTFTNVLEMLDLGGIPLRAAERGEGDPLVVAGGPAVFNVEPMADFLDLVFVGDGEALLPEFLDRLAALGRAGAPRAARIRELAGIEGLYAPSLYDTEPEASHGMRVPVPRDGAAFPVRRRILHDLDRFPFPDSIVVPHGEIVHDRVSVEIMRGCPVGCRFCQAGFVYRPARERDPGAVRDAVVRSIRSTGYDEFSLASLNSGRYGAIAPLLADLMDRFEPERVSVSLSSLHASSMTPELAAQVRRVRKSGFTLAPEAGTQRLRDVINKNLGDDEVLEACRLAFEAGWGAVKLYFMLGLPTETDEDVDAIADLAHRIRAAGREASGGGRAEVTLSASSFVPKASTPFQWLGMDRPESLRRKQARIAARLRRGVTFKHHDNDASFLEAVFARGDRRLAPVVERAWRAGARFDGWTEHLDLSRWLAAFAAESLDPAAYAHRELDPSARLPWDAVDAGIGREWLRQELRRALAGETVTPCGPRHCHGCGWFARECVAGATAGTARLPEPPAPCAGTSASGPAIGASEEAGSRHRYRVRYSKSGRLRFLGHLDLMRALLRGFRRARVPLLYSQGFNPKPLVAFGPALPLGIASEAEYLDLETSRYLDAEATPDRINAALPDGLRILAMREIRRHVPALGKTIRAARYRITAENGTDLAEEVAAFRARGRVVLRRERQGKERSWDLDEHLLGLEVLRREAVRLTIAFGGDGPSVRPEDLLEEIFGDGAGALSLLREDLLEDWNGRWINPFLSANVACDDGKRTSG